MDALGFRIVFESFATNLSSIVDTNGASDVFVTATSGSALSAVSVAWQGGVTGDGASHSPQISDNGEYVSFVSSATNLAFGYTGTNRGGDIYVRALSGPQTYWASRGTPDLLVGIFPTTPRTYSCFNHALSGDGLSVVYQANAGPLTSNVLLYFRLGMTNAVRIATDSDTVGRPQISTQGDWVAFSSRSNIYLWNRSTGSNTLISVSTNGAPANGPSHSPVMSRDPNARLIAFVSKATDLVSNAPPSSWQIYVHDRSAGITRLVSANTNGLPSKGDFELSNIAVASEGPPLVAFDGMAADLVANDLNGQSDVFVRDIAASTTRLISRAHTAHPARTATPMSGAPGSTSYNGRIIAFTSFDNPAVPDDTNVWQDVFVHDLDSAMVRCVSHQVNPAFGVSAAHSPRVAEAGSHVIYNVTSMSTGDALYWFDLLSGTNVLVGQDLPYFSTSARVSSNGSLVVFERQSQIYARRMPDGDTNLVSANHDNTGGGNAASTRPVLSPDSRWVAFESTSTNLTTNNPYGFQNLFVRDLLANKTEVASVGPNGSTQWGTRSGGVFSGNSRFVAFVGGNYPIVRRDLELKTSALVSNGGESPVMNWDGRFVAYQTLGFQGVPQIYVTDMQSGLAKLVSANLAGTNGNGASTGPSITPDGRFMVFTSLASDLVSNDNNNAADIFIADRILGSVLLLSMNSAGTGSANGASSKPLLSPDGRTVVFQSLANDLIPRDYNHRRDVFVATLAMPDSDDDGMDDDFEVTYFGNLSRNGAGDFDADGHSDHEEFLAGTNPTSDASILRVISISAPGTTTRQLVWSAVPGRTYAVQYRDSLEGSWSTLAGTVRAASSTAGRLDTTAAAGRFYRVVLAD
jgi:Tol biopolymer transport system component